MSKQQFPILYKFTERQQIQQWQIFVKDNTFYTKEGIKDGKITESLPTVCSPKNVGKKNETTGEGQAALEAAAKHKKKVEKGYNEVLTDEKNFFQPMLAEDAKKVKIDFNDKKKAVYGQPKLDGLRAVNDNYTLMSRNGKPYLACPHLLQGETTLDGELYNHSLKEDFNKIVSLCKKQKPTEEELQEAAKTVQYWVYDFPSQKGSFSVRYAALRSWYRNLKTVNPELARSIVVVDTKRLRSQEELDEFHAENMANGYEGTIIRIDEKDYENKRSKQLLKYKDFVDEEFVILGAVEGEGGRTGTLGKFNMRHDKNPKQTFDSNVKGDFRYLTYLWENKEKYIGKKATVKYFNRTPSKADGSGDVPRFPYIIKIDRDEYE